MVQYDGHRAIIRRVKLMANMVINNKTIAVNQSQY